MRAFVTYRIDRSIQKHFVSLSVRPYVCLSNVFPFKLMFKLQIAIFEVCWWNLVHWRGLDWPLLIQRPILKSCCIEKTCNFQFSNLDKTRSVIVLYSDLLNWYEKFESAGAIFCILAPTTFLRKLNFHIPRRYKF